MRKTRKGGVRIVSEYNQSNAIKHFIQNSTFELFSKAGISGIQVLATLAPGKQSPYRTVRTNYFNSEVRHILFKLFVVGSEQGYAGNYKITLVDDILRETQIQQDLYMKSLYSPDSLLEPVCPCVVFAHLNPITDSVKQRFETADNQIINDFLQSGDIGFIAMEFIDGYKTLSSFKGHPKFEIYKLMALYELNRMHKFGYMHNDFHFDNVLIHETYSYFDTNDFGRAIIIDFGLSDTVDEAASLQSLLREEYGKLPDNVFEIFVWFDNKHKVVQNTYISAYETRFNKPIKDIMSFFVFYVVDLHKPKYIGGYMSKLPPIKHLGIKPIQHDWDLPPAKELEQIVKEFFASSLEANPAAYKRFNDGVESVLEMERKDPDYLKKLMAAQGNGLLVDANGVRRTRKNK